MKKALAALLTTLAALAALFVTPATAQSVYAITNVTVVPMDRERLVPDQNVIVRNGRVAIMGPAASTPVPAGAVRIEGRGRYLMPGLAEMHAHVPPDPSQTQWTEDVLYLYAANGITVARAMLGAPHQLELRERAERGGIVSPRLYLSGPSLNGNSVATPEDGRRMVAEQKAAGYDFLKIHPGLDRARYDAIAETAHSVGIRFGGHVPAEVGVGRAMAAGQATIDHLDGYMPLLVPEGAEAEPPSFFGANLTPKVDESRIQEAVRRTREAGVWNVPTESLIRHVSLPDPENLLIAREEMRYVPADMRAAWLQARASLQGEPDYDPDMARRFADIRGKLIKALQDGGAGLLLGSDSPQWFNVPGFALHRELAILADIGLTPYEALATGTVNVARFLNAEGELGTVTPGARADLILLEANPLEDVGNVQKKAGVMLNGRWLPENEIRAGLAEIAARYAE